jgi:hypothetical protein
MGNRGCASVILALALAFPALPMRANAQEPPPPSAARILLVPTRMVSGDRATLAVLDFGGRLTPNVSIQFSNGDEIKTDATGRALYVAPLTPGSLFASIAGRPGKVKTLVVSPQQAAAYGIEVTSAPRLASLSDWFTLSGGGFCGDADKNIVTVGGEKALVLASSQLSLLVLPPSGLQPGQARVAVACGKQQVAEFSVTFLSLELHADDSPVAPGQQRTMTLRVHGTTAKVPLEARNLAPNVAELAGGNPARLFTSGGENNFAQFKLTGRNHGRILISIRLRPTYGRPRP